MGEGHPIGIGAEVKHVGVHAPAAGIDKELAIAAEGAIGHHPPPDPITQEIEAPQGCQLLRHPRMEAIGTDEQIPLPIGAVVEMGLHPGRILTPAQQARPGAEHAAIQPSG